MLSRITVYRQHGDLQQEVFIFWFRERDMELVLDEYHVQTKATKRHNWRTQESYNRLLSRHASIKREDVPLTDDIREAAKNKLIEMITVEE